MSEANYAYCPVCDTKALYTGEDDLPEGVLVMHDKCQRAELDAARGFHEETASDPDAVRSWEALRSSGLLWLINRVVFHPRGWAWALCRVDGQLVGWRLLGDGREVWRFEGDSEDDLFRRATDALTPTVPTTDPEATS